ncbi:universal stress protein [Pontibacter sp. SGAir0037]|uniref:universal stress protein n=1 Tax=Pontibacter sp. SGAir0037 TaxID=2571030 RepID=UPI0010CCF303|nr:universal stress protein [Pontibacter sp. SGAir0037]QCR21401.1 hypothetical protein C1N53_02910 [Pontibacter sp. SGAir0037]
MKTLFVPTDFSQDATNALLYALDMAKATPAKMIVFHAFFPVMSPPAAYEIPSLIPELERGKALELEEYVKEVQQAVSSDVVLDYYSTGGSYLAVDPSQQVSKSGYHTIEEIHEPVSLQAVNITCVAKMGAIFEQILSAATAYSADLVIMGMQGHDALSQALIGSTTLSVMRNSRIPVMGIPKGARFRGLRSVVFASDLSRQPDLFVLRKLHDFVRAYNPKLQVLHLYKHQDQLAELKKTSLALDVLDRQLRDLAYQVVLKQKENVPEGIQAFVQEQQADLLILSPQRHNWLDRLLNKSVTEKMTASSAFPLLTLPASEAREATSEEAEEAEPFAAFAW